MTDSFNVSKASKETYKGSVDIQHWDPEDNSFWQSQGKQVANRNLWISIPSLLCGFAVWLYWAHYYDLSEDIGYSNLVTGMT